MIGVVTIEFKAAVHVCLLDAQHDASEIEVFVDTGFNGELSLAPAVIARAGFELLDEVTVQLADGSGVHVLIFAGTILWNDEPRQVTVMATTGDPVFGMRLLEGSELKIEVKTGGSVTIEPL